MSDVEGPAISVKCNGCKYLNSERYNVQGDSGRDYKCEKLNIVIDENGWAGFAVTPKSCPFYPEQI